MSEVDRVAVDVVGLELLQVMENAGRNLAGAVSDRANGSPTASVVVLAGAGGDGGGGLRAARHLANHGVDVRVVLDRDPDDPAGAAATQLRLAVEAGADLVGRSDAGNDAGSGSSGGSVVADATPMLALPKTGLAGVPELWLVDIGVPRGVYERAGIDYDSPFAGRYRVRLVGAD